jgi:ribose transport system ATP-binding protein
MPLLRMQGICKQFPGVTALDSVDLELHAAEVLALIGENGAGKSTLMRILGGVVPRDRGLIEIDGAPAAIYSVRDAARYGIAFIHQELRLLENLDIAANIFLGREKTWGGPLALLDRNAIEAETARHLSRIGLTLSPRTPVRQLSLAQQQLVEIAKALSSDARLLIMDEPTSCLTGSETERLFQVISDLRHRGVSIIYISHRLHEIEQIADRVVALRDGRNAGMLERADIRHDQMVRLMVGRELSHLHSDRRGAKGPVCLKVQNLRTRRYPSAEVTLSVQRGEILGIAGLVGSGRTELARALFGTEPALSGNISIDGKSLDIRSPRRAIDAGLFLAPEDRRSAGLVLQMSVRENVTLPGLKKHALAGIIRRDSELRTTEKMCDRLNIKTPGLETQAANLSGGNQQKVVLAKWLALNPKVIVFDEPTRGIDVGAKAEVYRLMRELAEKDVAIIMISSEMEEILANSDRIAVMHDGRITGILDRSQCSEEAVMRLAIA